MVVKTEACDQPNVQCDCYVRKLMSEVIIKAGSESFSV